jgi:hypothetical protein
VASILAVLALLSALGSRNPVKSDAWEPSHLPHVVGAELIDLWLPADHEVLGNDLRRSPNCQDFKTFQKFLIDRGRKGVWYAAVVRWHYSDGRYEEMTFVRSPFDCQEHAEEFRDLLIDGAVQNGSRLMAGLSPRSLHLVNADQESRPPIEVISNTPGVEIRSD